jgi:hypothetical protein
MEELSRAIQGQTRVGCFVIRAMALCRSNMRRRRRGGAACRRRAIMRGHEAASVDPSDLEILTRVEIEITLRIYLERAASVGGARGLSAHGN